MVTRLRLKGRILLMDNVILISLLLGTTLMLILCINFFILVYELFLRSRVEALLTSYIFVADAFVALTVLAVSRVILRQVRLGTDRYFFRRSQKKGPSATDIFYYFSPRRAIGAIGFCVRLRLLKLLWLAVAFFPFSICLILLLYAAKGGVSSLVALVLAAGTVAFLLSGIYFYRNITASLFLARYHFISGDCLSFRQMISASQENMKNRRATLLKLKASFIGWFLLCLLIFPVGYVWGYYNQTLAVAANEFIDS